MAPKIESDITNRSFNAPPMKETVVSDESGFVPPSMPSQQRRQQQEQINFDERALRDFQNQLNRPPQQGRQLSEIEQEFMAKKKAKREGKERLSDGARKRIEMLLGMTRLTKEIEVDNQRYRIQTLTQNELRDAMVMAMEFDGSIQFIFEQRKQLLARSLIMVANLAIEDFIASDEIDDKLYLIDNMEHNLLSRLFNEYNALAKEAEDKYMPKTQAQVKEVLEDLKK